MSLRVLWVCYTTLALQSHSVNTFTCPELVATQITVVRALEENLNRERQHNWNLTERLHNSPNDFALAEAMLVGGILYYVFSGRKTGPLLYAFSTGKVPEIRASRTRSGEAEKLQSRWFLSLVAFHCIMNTEQNLLVILLDYDCEILVVLPGDSSVGWGIQAATVKMMGIMILIAANLPCFVRYWSCYMLPLYWLELVSWLFSVYPSFITSNHYIEEDGVIAQPPAYLMRCYFASMGLTLMLIYSAILRHRRHYFINETSLSNVRGKEECSSFSTGEGLTLKVV